MSIAIPSIIIGVLLGLGVRPALKWLFPSDRRCLSIVIPKEIPDVHLVKVYTTTDVDFTRVEVVDTVGERYRLVNDVLKGGSAQTF